MSWGEVHRADAGPQAEVTSAIRLGRRRHCARSNVGPSTISVFVDFGVELGSRLANVDLMNEQCLQGHGVNSRWPRLGVSGETVGTINANMASVQNGGWKRWLRGTGWAQVFPLLKALPAFEP